MAQSCNENITPTTPDERFVDRGDGTVQDKYTGLIWMRCALGQTWDGTTCSGDASTYNWQLALQAADGYTFASSSAWRLPNINELKSIVEKACYDPAINVTAFPTTPSDGFWTSSTYAYVNDYAWRIHFYAGEYHASHRMKLDRRYVRLVRFDSN